MSPTMIGVLVLILLFVLFFMGLEIGIAMALAGFIGYAAIVGLEGALNVLAIDLFHVFSSYNLLVILLFVLMGQFGSGAGISKKLYDSAYKFIGHVPGGLAMATIGAATVFKTICGSSAATAATFATIACPEMDRYGYGKKLSTGSAATVGTLGCIIPPSVTLLLYGTLTQTSIGRLFLAGIIPGLILAFSFVATIFVWCKINPNLGPKGEKSTWRQRITSLRPMVWVIIIFIVVVGGLMKGFFVPTEAGSVGAFAVLLLVVLKREMKFKEFVKSTLEALSIGCMILTLIMGATILGHFFAATKIPFVFAEWVGALPLPRDLVIMLILIAFLIGGSIIDDLAFIILSLPIFFPVVVELGYDPVWFGVMFCVTAMIGIILPPMAICVFVVSGITKVPLSMVYKGTYPFLVGMSICLLIFLFFPQISLWLPNLLMK